MTSTTFPSSAGDLTNEWLTDILHDSGLPSDMDVTGFSVGPIGDPGQTSEVARIELEYDKPTTEAPPSLIGKFPAAFDQAQMLAGAMGAYRKEVQFFKFIAPSVPGIVPKCFAAEIKEESHEFILILEDLSDLRLGNPYDGSTYAEESSLMLDKIAPLHAKWWNHPDLDTFDWIVQPGTAAYTDRMKMAKDYLSDALLTVKQSFRRYMSDNAWAVAEKWLGMYDEMAKSISGGPSYPRTIYHGDYHWQQCFFPSGEKDRFAIIDWQTVGIGHAARDVVRTLLFEPGQRRAHEKPMVERYHSLLVENGVSDYSLEALWEDIRFCAMIAAEIYILALAHSDNELLKAKFADRGLDAYEVILTWLGSALDDWGVDEALDRYLER